MTVPDIVLTTLNAKYIHAAFGLRYLLANLGDLQPRAGLAEFDIHQRPLDIAEKLLAQNPKIIGFGIYIWNVEPTAEVIAAVKRVRPDIKIIIGGPEVSYETEDQKIVQLADHVITGEADLKFAEVCRVLLERRANYPKAGRRQPLPVGRPTRGRQANRSRQKPPPSAGQSSSSAGVRERNCSNRLSGNSCNGNSAFRCGEQVRMPLHRPSGIVNI